VYGVDSASWVEAGSVNDLDEGLVCAGASTGDVGLHGAVSVEAIEGWECVSGHSRLWNWSKCLGHDVSNVHTKSFEIVVCNFG